MKEKYEDLVTPSQALWIALEDSVTSLFIKTHFHNPEKNPEITSRRWISRKGNHHNWNVEIIEKFPFPLNSTKKVLNVALVEVDGKLGKIVKRRLLSNVFDWEYKRYIRGNSKKNKN